jgi:hypothetical protein
MSSKGLGDTVEKILKAAGVQKAKKECSPCKKRKERLNKMFPYKRRS